MGMHQMLGPISGSADPDPIDVTRSLRFNSGDSAYLSRTPSSVGNRRTWTYSCWVKRTTIGGVYPRMFGNYHGGSYQGWDINFLNNDKIDIHYDTGGGNYIFRRTTTQVFRDPSAWYHIVVAVDTTDATANDRVKLYVNGEQITAFDTNTNAAQNTDTNINTAIEHRIGYNYTYSDFYLANIQFIDGEALQPSKFGVLNDDNVWVPAEYSDSYGTNGFYLQFNSTATATLGDDTSGNNNDYTPNNLTGTDAKLFVDKKPDGSNWGNIANAFDGNTSTYADGTYNNGTTSTITFNPPLTGVTSLRFYWYGTSNYGYNGSNVGSGSTTAEYKSVYSGSAITVNSIQGTSQPGNGVVRLYAIEVNGSVLTGYSRGTPAGIDSVIDTPTNYTAGSGNNGGNYAIWNALGPGGTSTYGTLSNGNLDASLPASGKALAQTLFPQSGKWYCEIDFVSGGGAGGGLRIGVINEKNIAIDLGSTANSWAYLADGRVYHNASAPSYGVSSSPGDTLMMCLDIDAGKLWYGKNGTWMASGNPGAGSNPSQTFTAGQKMSFSAQSGSGTVQVINANWGQRSFAYTPPSGFLSVCTQNLANPTIADGSTVFDTKLWTGDGTSSRSIDTYGFSPDFIWGKSRSHTNAHWMMDVVRGANKRIEPNATDAEDTPSGIVTSFDSNGFTMGSNTENNGSGRTYVGWAWDAGSSTASNTSGTINSSVRVNQSAGFSIVSYTGNNTQGATIGHGLNAVPDFVIIKNRSYAEAWDIYHQQVGYGKVMRFSTATPATASDVFPSSHSSSVIKVGSSRSQNGNSEYMIAYCFTPVAGYSAFGSYTGNGSTDGPFVELSFTPKFILLKNKDVSSVGHDWFIHDTERDPYNVSDSYIKANTIDAEATHNMLDFVSNGFKIRTNLTSYNGNGNTHLYAAFAEHPFKTARGQ